MGSRDFFFETDGVRGGVTLFTERGFGCVGSFEPGRVLL